jgi:molybdenum cofactor cytidylyltransferase
MIAAIVPAAGRSIRMGRPKLLMVFDGESLIHRVVTALRKGGAGRIVVVPPVGAPEAADIADEASAAGAEVVIPEIQPAEMRDSVELGLAVLDSEPRPHSVLLTPGDVPGISAATVARLLRIARDHPDRVIIPTHEGHRGHPIVLPWEIAVAVRDLPEDAGVNRLVEEHREKVLEVRCSDPGEIDDVDTPDDLRRWAGSHDRIRVSVRLFAIARERAGQSAIEIELAEPANVGGLREALQTAFPRLDTLAWNSMISVDEEYAPDETPVTAASRVALIPPVSGGAVGLGSEAGT